MKINEKLYDHRGEREKMKKLKFKLLIVLLICCFFNSNAYARDRMIIKNRTQRIMNVLENAYWEKKTRASKIAYVYCAVKCPRCIHFEKLIKNNNFGLEFRFYYADGKNLGPYSSEKLQYNKNVNHEIFSLLQNKSFITPVLIAPVKTGMIVAQADNNNIKGIANQILSYKNTARVFDKDRLLGTIETKNTLINIKQYVNHTKKNINIHQLPNTLSPVSQSLSPGYFVGMSRQNGSLISEPGWLQVTVIRVDSKSSPGYIYDPVFAKACLENYQSSFVNNIFYAQTLTHIKNVPSKNAATRDVLQIRQGLRKKNILTTSTGEKWLELEISKDTVGYIPYGGTSQSQKEGKKPSISDFFKLNIKIK